MRRIKSLLIIVAGLLLAGCGWIDRPHEGPYDHVLVYCALGYNNLADGSDVYPPQSHSNTSGHRDRFPAVLLLDSVSSWLFHYTRKTHDRL